MSMIKYKILQAIIEDNSIVMLPEKSIPLGVISIPEELKIQAPRVHLPGIPGRPTDSQMQSVISRNYLAFLMEYNDWVEAFPEATAQEGPVTYV